MTEIRNHNMNFGFGVTLASPALAFTATGGDRRVLWAAMGRRRGSNVDA
jgi:hypothetical protein